MKRGCPLPSRLGALGTVLPRVPDHQPCPKQRLQRARHRSPAGRSRFVGDGDDLVDVSTPVCHQVGDRHGS